MFLTDLVVQRVNLRLKEGRVKVTGNRSRSRECDKMGGDKEFNNLDFYSLNGLRFLFHSSSGCPLLKIKRKISNE